VGSLARPHCRVVLADDHALLRESVRLFLGAAHAGGSFEVVGEAADTRDAIQVCLDLRPDALVLDISMPNGSAIHAIQQLLAELRNLKVVVLTMHDDPALLRAALAAGALGYVLKSSTHTRLLGALGAAVAGRTYVDAAFPAELVAAAAVPAGSSRLSARERQVLTLLAAGLSYRDAADQLHVGARTVESHRRRIAEKLGLRTRAELLRYCLEVGLVTPPSAPGAARAQLGDLTDSELADPDEIIRS
jgi:two-component system response regulator NreC